MSMAEDGTPAGGRKPGHKGGPDPLVLALATGCSVTDAAQRAGLARRTVYRRLEDPDFRREVTKARDELLFQVVGRLMAVAIKAADTLEKQLDSKNEVTSQRAA